MLHLSVLAYSYLIFINTICKKKNVVPNYCLIFRQPNPQLLSVFCMTIGDMEMSFECGLERLRSIGCFNPQSHT